MYSCFIIDNFGQIKTEDAVKTNYWEVVDPWLLPLDYLESAKQHTAIKQIK